jgi:SAM-dependent methyltransferase
LSFERDIRLEELSSVIGLLPPGGRILEIGAGAGWQSEVLTRAGYRVASIDLPGSGYRSLQRGPVVQYDGYRMPFGDARFQCLFSSNVLEHVKDLEAFQVEARRVLKADGVAIHLMPSAMWRFWTFWTHYLFLIKKFALWTAQCQVPPQSGASNVSMVKRTWPELLRRILLPERHGEFGNSVTESYYFSRFRWRSVFLRTGWIVAGVRPTRLFYTGHLILDRSLSVRLRHFLSFVLGSSCLIYVLHPGPTDDGLRQ